MFIQIVISILYMLDNGIAGPSSSSWASPCLLVPKSYNTHRFCSDFCKVNKTRPFVHFPEWRTALTNVRLRLWASLVYWRDTGRSRCQRGLERLLRSLHPLGYIHTQWCPSQNALATFQWFMKGDSWLLEIWKVALCMWMTRSSIRMIKNDLIHKRTINTTLIHI